MNEMKAMLAMQFLSGRTGNDLNPKLIAIAVDHAEAVIAEIDKRDAAAKANAAAAAAPVTPPPAP